MGQQWINCDPKVRNFVEKTVVILQEELSKKLQAIFLHGSLAMGSFYPPKSDIDLLILCHEPLTLSEQKKLHVRLLDLTAVRPITGFLELSIVLSNIAKNPPHPIPFEFHFSETFPKRNEDGSFSYDIFKGNDYDLAAHFMVTKKRGISLYGPQPEDVLGNISWKNYLQAVFDDLSWILDNENIMESPFYGVLNCCRVAQMMAEGEGTVASKEEGALWALEHFPLKFHPLIEKALNCYRSSTPVNSDQRRTNGMKWDREELLAFRDYMRNHTNGYSRLL